MIYRLFYILAVIFAAFSLISSAPAGRKKKKRPSETESAPAANPVSYLEKYGYLLTGVQHSEKSMESAILSFQKFAGISETGLLDRATQTKILAPRCGVEDILGTAQMGSKLRLETNGTSRYRNRRYTLGGSKWSKTHLTYYYDNYTPDLTRAQTRDAILRAFNLWSDASTLTFAETSDRSRADIIIEFNAGVHSDGAYGAFDGPGGTLAHAYFPENGDAHFDEDELFTEGTSEGVNLYIVAAHEFGHSLGLSHSSDTNALMYPWYLGYIEDFQLPQDDINGIQQLYGKPDVERIPPTPAIGGGGDETGSTDEDAPPCDGRWDAATYFAADDVVYAFKGKYVWALTEQGIVSGYPKKTKKVFKSAPSGITAAVTSGRRTYLFKAKKVWRYYDKQLENGFPQPIQKGNPSNPNAALLWGGNGRIYLFKGARFQEFKEYDLSVGESMKIEDQWKGVPTKLDAALQWKNGKTYFFKGNKYWRFNDNKRAVSKDYPKSRTKYWMGCGMATGQDLPARLVLAPSGTMHGSSPGK